MDSSYERNLKTIFREIYLWRRYRHEGGGEFQWNDLHISIVEDYFLKFSNICHFTELSSAKWLDDDFSQCKNDTIIAKQAASFVQELDVIFWVPTLKNLTERRNHITKFQLVEGFIRFLLRLLCHKTDLMLGQYKDRVDRLEKELRLLLTILGDASFLLCDYEHEQVENLMPEFEEVANKAGSLVHSLFFSIDGASRAMESGILDVLSHIEFKKNFLFTEFLDLLSSLSRSANRTPKTSVMDSILIVDSLTHYLEDLMKQEDNQRIADVKKKLKILREWLISVKSSIDETWLQQSEQLSEAGELKGTLMLIGDTAHEAEYIIISFLVGDAPFEYLDKRLTDITHNIEHIGTEFQEITNKYKCGKLKIVKDFSARLPLQSKRKTEIDDVTVGFEEKQTCILDLLERRTKLQVISIFGMPGLGKTTLARKLYNHPIVKHRFDILSWCVVSQTYQRKSILTNILINVKSELDKDMVMEVEEESLVLQIYQTLKGRRYLIVLDDIWDSKVWDDLLRCFPNEENGSKILFTTRNKDVAPHESMIYELPSLSNDQCWQLLEKKVFNNEPCPPELLGIGKKVATNCCGLPLAVVVIAGILSTMDKEKSTWEEVGRKLATYIFGDQGNSVMQILKLSYTHLPQHLVPCFLLFGAFQEDEEIHVGMLMRLWIAEGFIHKEKEKSAEDVAQEYLMELIDKSLVMVAKIRSDGGVKTCRVHDLLRDLCLTLCEEENYLKIMKSNYHVIYEQSHRVYDPISISNYSQHVHSLHGCNLDSPLNLREMKLLRVLHFDRFSDGCHLFGSEFLVLLRYLVIGFLPASISSLTNLEYLRVMACGKLNLPPTILKMKKLRCLHMALGEARYDKECDSSQTNNLEFLTGITFSKCKDELMLKCSPHLRKLKCYIAPSQHVDLHFLTQLESLKVASTSVVTLLEEIILPSNIKKLTLCDFIANSEKMSMIGRLKNLEVLKLDENTFIGNSWDTRDGEFEKLKFLKLSYISHLTEWNVESSQHFPVLQRLILISCYHLEEIPYEIGEIPTLQLIKVDEYCHKSLAESAKRIQQEQWEMGNEELEVRM